MREQDFINKLILGLPKLFLTEIKAEFKNFSCQILIQFMSLVSFYTPYENIRKPDVPMFSGE